MTDCNPTPRQCTMCQQWYPLTAEYWHRHGNRFFAQCKSCRCAIVGKRLVPIDPRKIGVPAGHKRCTECDEILPTTREYFYSDVRAKDGLQVACIQCFNKDHRDYVDRNKEKVQESKRRHYRENKDRVKLHVKNYRDSNKDEINERFRIRYKQDADHIRARNRDWKKTHYPTIKASLQRRRARKLNLPNNFSKADYDRMMQYWGNRCCICGRTEGLWHTIVFDHWIPLSDARADNPGTVPCNIVPMCHTKKGVPAGEICCNNSKTNKPPIEWLIEKLGKRKAKLKLAEIEAYFEWVTAL